jgi:probable F420-dependent oxidoreductase
MKLTGVGIWSGELRHGDPGEAAEAAAELEGLGYEALWVPEGGGGPLLDPVRTVLSATRRITVATGILNVWLHEPPETAAAFSEFDRAHPGRFLLGLGISHAELFVSSKSNPYRHPVAAMADYLSRLDGAATPVPASRRVLAALGPRMLELARERSAGAHPYLATPEHTRGARAILGAGALLAPEQPVVLEPDRARARELARQHVARYLDLPNFTNNLRRLGFGDGDLAGSGSDRLVDAVVAQGDTTAIRARVQAQRDAGADHVCVHVLPARDGLPRVEWRELAPALIGI